MFSTFLRERGYALNRLFFFAQCTDVGLSVSLLTPRVQDLHLQKYKHFNSSYTRGGGLQ